MFIKTIGEQPTDCFTTS